MNTNQDQKQIGPGRKIVGVGLLFVCGILIGDLIGQFRARAQHASEVAATISKLLPDLDLIEDRRASYPLELWLDGSIVDSYDLFGLPILGWMSKDIDKNLLKVVEYRKQHPRLLYTQVGIERARRLGIEWRSIFA